MRWDKEKVAEFRRRQYLVAQTGIDNLIAATPSGPVRDLITSANIMLLQAEKMQKEADDVKGDNNG
jgi:hypothetical protein